MRPPFATAVREILDQFLLFRIYRDHGLTVSLERLDPGIDLLKLSIAVGVGCRYPSLAIGLEAVTQLVKQRRHRPLTDLMALAGQFFGKVTGTLAGPQQRGHGITPGIGLQDNLQVLSKAWVRLCQGRTATTEPTNAVKRDLRLRRLGLGLDYGDTGSYGMRGKASGNGNKGNPTVTEGESLGRRPAVAGPLIQMWFE